MRRAVREGWISLTLDKDFYKRIYEDRLPAPPGVVQFSMPYPKPREAGERLLELLAGGIQLDGFFTLIARHDFEQYTLP